MMIHRQMYACLKKRRKEVEEEEEAMTMIIITNIDLERQGMAAAAGGFHLHMCHLIYLYAGTCICAILYIFMLALHLKNDVAVLLSVQLGFVRNVCMICMYCVAFQPCHKLTALP